MEQGELLGGALKCCVWPPGNRGTQTTEQSKNMSHTGEIHQKRRQTHTCCMDVSTGLSFLSVFFMSLVEYRTTFVRIKFELQRVIHGKLCTRANERRICIFSVFLIANATFKLLSGSTCYQDYFYVEDLLAECQKYPCVCRKPYKAPAYTYTSRSPGTVFSGKRKQTSFDKKPTTLFIFLYARLNVAAICFCNRVRTMSSGRSRSKVSIMGKKQVINLPSA